MKSSFFQELKEFLNIQNYLIIIITGNIVIWGLFSLHNQPYSLMCAVLLWVTVIFTISYTCIRIGIVYWLSRD